MKKVISRLVLFFVIIVIMLAALGVIGFAATSEGNLGNLRLPLQGLCLVIPLAGIFIAVLAVKSVSRGMPLHEQANAKKISLYEQILDAIPFPITVTDINMKWLFVNKPVCDMLNRKRDEFYGKHCSSWGAAICNTENCGIANLRKGKPSTTFTQFGNDYHVDVFYIFDSTGSKAGHIELVRDITTETNLKKQQSEIVNYLASLSNSFTEASSQVTSESHTLAQDATEQASYIASLSESVAEINRMVKDNAQATTTALDEVQQECRLMAACREQMQHLLEAMRTINEKSHNISKTTKVIDNIAFQTNILALNAAVEAARVGQHGKGFAVVAEEVRNLASRSAEAARETSVLIESSFQSVMNGNKIVDKVNDSLNALMEGSQKNAEQIAEVQAVSIRQSEAMEQIAASIERMSAILQQNNATAEELASTSTDMNKHTDKLHETILTLSNDNTYSG